MDDAGLKGVIFDGAKLLVLGLGDADIVVRQERVIVGTKIRQHLETKPFLGSALHVT